MSSFFQWWSTHSSGIDQSSFFIIAISCAHGKLWVRRTMQPHATGSTPMEADLFNSLRIKFSAYVEMIPRSSLNSGDMKLRSTTVELLSNETLISVCWSSSRECMLVQHLSKFPWLVRSCLFNRAWAFSALCA